MFFENYIEKISDLCKGSAIKMLKVLFSILTLVVTIYALLCTVYSDVIVQNGNDFLDLPRKCLSEKEIKTTFDDLIGKEKATKSLYAFVLDISGSINKYKVEEEAYSKYRSSIESITKALSEKVVTEKRKEMINIFDIAKSRLYDLLLALLKKNKNDPNCFFSVWIVGNDGIKIYPDDDKIPVGLVSIKNAIKAIDKSEFSAEENTNFLSLFDGFRNFYGKELSSTYNQQENSTFFITILSDLINDVDKKYDKSRAIEDKWKELKERIQDFCNAKIMSNMIVFSENEPDIQRSIFSLFKENIEWYRLNKYLIGDEKIKDYLFSVRNTEKNIEFYYENSTFTPGSNFTLRCTGKEKNTIKIDIPLQANDNFTQKISINCQRLNANGDALDDSKRIMPGGSETKVELETGEQIRLTFSGRLPSVLSAPILRISMCNEGKTYLVPINFIKRLPDWASHIFDSMKKIGIGVLILFLGVFLGFLGVKFFNRDDKQGKPGGKKTKDSSSPGSSGQDTLKKNGKGKITKPKDSSRTRAGVDENSSHGFSDIADSPGAPGNPGEPANLEEQSPSNIKEAHISPETPKEPAIVEKPSTQNQVNINKATKEELMDLDDRINDEIAQKIIDKRKYKTILDLRVKKAVSKHLYIEIKDKICV